MASETRVNNPPLSLLDTLVEIETLVSSAPENRMLLSELKCSKQWTHLKFMEVHLKLQLFILSLAEEEYWHLVSTESSNLGLFQLVHGFMTTNGQHVPAIVDSQLS